MSTVATLLKQKNSDIWRISPEKSVFDAIKLMDEKGVGALLVVQNNSLVGIVSERDYARKVILKGKTSKETRVTEIMTRQVLYVTPDHTINDCMVLMTGKRIRHLPVLQEDDLVGIISLGDVVEEIIREQKSKIKELENYISWEENY
ncbi:MAG: CBS domain-containing protein [Gammaproteobacteria bacterium]|nr:CBS domain-containing protein [Gammaproteobacteria bacterium]